MLRRGYKNRVDCYSERWSCLHGGQGISHAGALGQFVGLEIDENLHGDADSEQLHRQVELGGPLHSKGVLILTAFLAERFGHNIPLSLSASLVFEQSYGEVEGDSASLAAQSKFRPALPHCSRRREKNAAQARKSLISKA